MRHVSEKKVSQEGRGGVGGRGNLSSGWSEVWEERQSLTRAVGL